MKVVGWEEKRGSIKTGQLGTGFLGPGFTPGSRVCSFRKFPRLSLPVWILFPVIPPTIMREQFIVFGTFFTMSFSYTCGV